MRVYLLKLFLTAFIGFIFYTDVSAACAAQTRTWDGDSNFWSTASAWSGNNVPNTTSENALVPSAGVGYLWIYNGNFTVSCVEVTSGLLAFWTNSLTVTGDYFKATTPSSIYFNPSTTSGRLIMGGSSAQTLEAVDTIPNITVSNNTSVTFEGGFKSLTAPVLSGSSTTLYIDDDYEVLNNSAWTIPNGVTVYIRNASKVTLGGNLTVNGTLILEAGASLELANSRTLSVGASGLLQINGASGNAVSISTPSGGTFTFNVSGAINASYFQISRTNSAGLNVTGTIQLMEFGEFHEIANSGYAMTIGSGVSLPDTMEGLGFFNEGGSGSGNINASAYNGAASDVYLDLWQGDLGGEANDLDSNGSCGGDPPGCFEWGTEDSTKMTLTNTTASGSPPATINPGSGDTLFATFSFALTKADTATDITSLTISSLGTASITEIGALKIYSDNGDCSFGVGDSQISTDQNLSGSPATATFSIPSSTVTLNSTTPVCIHLISSATTLAIKNNTIGFQIAETLHVTNSFGYDFTTSSGPPLSTALSTIGGGWSSQWTGSNSVSSTTNGNWFLNDPPSSTENCQIGQGERVCRLDANLSCNSAELPANGTLNFNNAARTLNIYGNLTVESGYTFQNTASATIQMRGNTNQGIEVAETFPGDLIINNTGAAGNDEVIATGTSDINGDVTIQNGHLTIGNGVTFKITGTLTIQSGGALTVSSGGTLIFGNGSVLQVNSGGTLSLLGNTTLDAVVTSDSTSSSYTINVNGTIAAQHYTLSRLGLNGLTIQSGATIDGTNRLQNGSYTYPVGDNGTFLRLFSAVPTHSINNISFESAGSSAINRTNVYTDSGIGAGTLNITTYTGDLAGPSFDNDNTYLISWSGATNSLDLSVSQTTPASLSAGSAIVMGQFDFQQTLAGASYNDTDITNLTITATGTGTVSDIDTIDIYYDSNCDATGGVLIGSQAPSGTPASATFSISAGQATVQADTSSPPTRCIYVEYDINSATANGKTLGAKINTSTHITNSESYDISGGTSFPLTLGSPGTVSGAGLTIWTGNTSTNWFTASNWTAGLPDSTKSCQIPNTGNDPFIDGNIGTAVCKSVDVTNGVLTFLNGTSAQLEVYGSYTQTGTVNINDGSLVLRDDGATATSQSLQTNATIPSLTFNKTAGGSVVVSGGGSPVIINNLTFPSGQNFNFRINSGENLKLPNGVSIPSGVTFTMASTTTLNIYAGQSLTLNGGVFETTGINDAYPQSTSNKAHISHNGTGRWSFVANSGTVSLTGFLLSYLDVNGLQISGSTNLTNFDGGQFNYLIPDYSTPVRALNLSTSTAISETTASNVGFNWGAANSTYSAPTSPASTDNYFLVHATNCGSQALTFDQWFGNFWGSGTEPDTQDKILDSADGAYSCTVSIDKAASPVSIQSLAATPYSDAIDVKWETTLESDHKGFNVYRSQFSNYGFAQLNSKLILTSLDNSSHTGNYVFRDQSIQQNQTYYYLVEDVATNGATTMHGPVSAKALASHSNAPALNPQPGSDEAPSENTPPSQEEHERTLAPGVKVLVQSGHNSRIEIIPGDLTIENASWNNSYKTIQLPYYSSTATPGTPEVLTRTILIPVEQASLQVNFTEYALEETAPASLLISPSPHWTPDPVNGQLVPSWTPDTNVYNQNEYLETSYYNVENQTRNIQGQHYIAIHVSPVLYHPLNQLYKKANKITLDLALNEAPWNTPLPSSQEVEAPLNKTSLAHLKIKKTGFYQLTYDELVNNYSEGPFIGAQTNQLTLYYGNKTLPIEVSSADSIFNSGDSIQFYIKHESSLHDNYSHLVLAPFPLSNQDSPNRIPAVAAAPTSDPDSVTESRQQIHLEENLYEVTDRSLGENVDHFFHKRVYVSPETQGASASQFSLNFDLAHPVINEQASAELQVNLVSKTTQQLSDFSYQIAITLNGVPAQKVFHDWFGNSLSPQTISFPSTWLKNGSNTLEIELQPQSLSANQFSIVDMDWFKISYNQSHSHDLSPLSLLRLRSTQNLEFYSTDSSTQVFDVSHFEHVKKLTSLDYTPAEQLFKFNPPSEMITTDGQPLGLSGSQLIALSSSQFLSVDQVTLTQGFNLSLKAQNQGFNYIVISNSSIQSHLQPLLEHKQNQGLIPLFVDQQQIYNEFSRGQKNPQAIKDFLNYALNDWVVKPKYVLLVGDSSSDPKNHFSSRSSQQIENLIPIYQLKGSNFDYFSDLWFVSTGSNDSLYQPQISIGRVPSSDPIKIDAFVNKVISYEQGNHLDENAVNQLSYFSDNDQNSEGFSEASLNLFSQASQVFSKLAPRHFIRGNDDSAFKASLIGQFNSTPSFLMTLNGHGAESVWADQNVFSLTDVESLSNSSYPLTIALNCLNGYFHSDDENTQGLGEALLLKQQAGSIAFWGSTNMTSPRAQQILASNFHVQMAEHLNQGNSEVRLGDIILESQHRIPQTSGYQEVLMSWTLLGDPSLKFPEKAFTEIGSEAPNNDRGLASVEPSGGNSGGGCSLGASPSQPKEATGSHFLWLFFMVLPGLLLFILRKTLTR